MKKVFILFVILMSLFITTGCDLGSETETETDTITFTGLESTDIEYGGSIDLMDGVTCNSSINGDITSQIETSGEVNTTYPGVYFVTYSVVDANDNLVEETKRFIVIDNYDTNLIFNGDFHNSSYDWIHVNNGDYNEHVFLNVHPELEYFQVVITQQSEVLDDPYICQKDLTIMPNTTYRIEFIVSSTEAAYINFDLVKLSEVNVVIDEYISAVHVDVTPGFEEYSYEYIYSGDEPLEDVTFRLLFGNDGSSEITGEIYIDNIRIYVVE